jgi:putative peptide zinc metalloprotease protein
VKNLKVKLRPGAQISRQYYRGERWYVVRDPAGNQYHRLSDPAYRFVGLLDGSRTVEEAWDLCGGTMADDAPTQPEVIQILTHLYGANLIDADVTPDATVLLRRHKNQAKRKFQQRLMNVLFPRIPLWDPDRFLVRWMPLVRQLFSKFGAIVWLAVVIAACVFVASKSRDGSHDLVEAAKHSVNLEQNPQNVVWLWGVFVFVKLIHELGHAFGCRRFGGECHELGIMFLVFVPTPYVDASTAWSFSNKWQRIFVGAAGMIVELFFASLCAIAWCMIGDPMHNFWGQLAFNAMLVASVTTIIFNANPLLRYDGYYILSDWLEIPNLRQKSQEYTLGLIKRHVFRVKQQQPLPPITQRFWLFLYYCTSGVYRIFVGIMIILLVAFQIPILGILMAVGGLITWLVMPVFKIFKYLTIEPELHRKRGRATAFVLAVASVIVVVVGVIQFPLKLHAQGIAEPAVREVVRPRTAGFVEKLGDFRDGQWVKKGDVILVLRSEELQARIAMVEARLRSAELQLSKAAVDAPSLAKQAAEEIGIHRDQLKDLYERRDDLVVRAPIDGELVAPQLPEMQGVFLPPGQDIAMVIRRDQLVIHTALEQADAEPVLAHRDTEAYIRMSGDIKTVLRAGQPRKALQSSPDVRHPALTQIGGGTAAPDPRDPAKSAVPLYDVEVPMDNAGGTYVPWQRVHVQFVLDRKPLAWQWARRFRQLIQEHASGSKWL